MTDSSRKATDSENPYASPIYEPLETGSSGADEHIDSDPTARISFAPDYMVEAHARYRQQREGKWILNGLRMFAIVGFTLFVLGAISLQNYAIAVFFAAFTLLLIVAQYFDNWRIRHALNSSPHANEELTIEFSDAGYHAWPELQDVHFRWSVFTKVVHFKDGMPLAQGPKMFHWIPISAFAGQSAIEQVERLLRAYIAHHVDRRSSAVNRSAC